MNQAANTNDLRKDIINILTKIDDVKKLKLIFQQAEEIGEMSNAEDRPGSENEKTENRLASL